MEHVFKDLVYNDLRDDVPFFVYSGLWCILGKSLNEVLNCLPFITYASFPNGFIHLDYPLLVVKQKMHQYVLVVMDDLSDYFSQVTTCSANGEHTAGVHWCGRLTPRLRPVHVLSAEFNERALHVSSFVVRCMFRRLRLWKFEHALKLSIDFYYWKANPQHFFQTDIERKKLFEVCVFIESGLSLDLCGEDLLTELVEMISANSETLERIMCRATPPLLATRFSKIEQNS